ncbi:MAG: pentapeptide repeat-containing protein, partial [Cyanobacteria bacterium]|nr:pentapeptide repeat-containing protein [Cyanobacteriota bacterium]
MSHSEKSLNTLSGPNFAGADFSGANFSGANLSGANFAGANLAGAIFHPQDQQVQNPQEPVSNLQTSNFQNFISVAKPNQDNQGVAQGPASLPEYPVLNCNGSQLRVISWEPRVFTIENFLSPTECDYLIELAKPQMTRSQVFDVGNGDSKVEGERTSRGCFFNTEPYCSNNVVNDIERRIAEITLIAPIYGQSFQILHYGVGQKYDPHHDYFDPAFAGSQTVIQKRGQRFGTFLIYLTTPEKG